ncbi:RHS repeat domain-containing protein [Lysobacter sp. P5_B9]
MKQYAVRAGISVCLLFASVQALAIEPFQEYRKRVESSQNIAALTDGLFGDKVNLYNGQTTFSGVDIYLPGNNSLPVQLLRQFSVQILPQNSTGWDTSLGGAGGWDVDVPYISAMLGAVSGWSNQRCSSNWVPSVNPSFQTTEIWQGNSIHIPGGGDRTMLGVEAQTPVQQDGVTHRITTSERDSFDCIPMLGGLAGEGFRMKTTSGVRYYFDVAVQRYGGTMTRPLDSKIVASTSRTKVYLLASKIEDRFGNTVNFQYNANGNPTRIWSSDGREIVLTYVNDLLNTASAAGKTWSYQYTTVEGQARLSAVVQPDTSRWQFTYSNSLRPVDQSWDGDSDPYCAIQPPELPANFTFTVTHPSKAVGTFTFSNTRHYRSGVHISECLQRHAPPGGEFSSDYWILNTPYFFDVMSLGQKTISGPGLTQPMTWMYDYGISDQSLWGSGGPAVYPCTTCATEKSVTVTNPDGTKTKYRYGFLYALNEGRVLGVDTLDAGNVVRRSEITDYMSEAEAASGQGFFTRYGLIYNGDDPSTARVRPLVRRIVQQDGATFTSEVAKGCTTATAYCFDAFARAAKERKFSSLGYTRDDTTEYQDDAVKWVLHQVKRTTVAGIEVDRTDFDAATVLPIRTYKYGKLQQTLTYNADSTVATVSDGRDGVGGAETTVTLSTWKRGTPQSITHPATPESPTGATQSAAVNDDGTIASVTDETGARTCYGYDAMGRLASITYPSESQVGVCDSSTWNPTYIAFEQQTTAAYGLPAGYWRRWERTGNAWAFKFYDAFWRPVVEETYDSGNVAATLSQTVKRYDASGRLAFQSYPSSTVSDYGQTLSGSYTSYDALGRVVQVKQDSELGQLTTTTEYRAGFQTAVTNPRGSQTLTIYQAYDQPTYDQPSGISELGGDRHTEIYRDVFGKVYALRRRNGDGSQAVWRWYVYDAQQQLCKVIEPEAGATVMAYDGAGNLTHSWAGLSLPDTANCNYDAAWASGRLVWRQYNARNLVDALRFPDGRGDQNIAYTPDGLTSQITTYNEPNNAASIVNAYAYNKRRLLTGETLDPWAPGSFYWQVGYSYDANGALQAQSYPTGLYVDYAPNALGQPTRAGTYATGVSYYPNGAIKQFTYGNGIVHTMTQNARQLPVRSTDGGGVLNDVYAYDKNGNVESTIDELVGVGVFSPRSRWMNYDGLDRLTAAGAGMFGGTDNWHHFTYDALDNLKSWKLAGVKDYANYYYDANNRLTNIQNSAGATIVGLGYDEQGNLRNKNGQEYKFYYDNRLREVVGKEYYRYDGHGRRVLAWRPGGTMTVSYYGQAGQLLYQENSTSTLASEHIYLGGSLIATHERNWATNTYATKYQHTDALGSPVAVTNESGQVIDRTQYEPFGAAIGKPSYDGIGYTGHVMDGATGLSYMQQRYYDPTIGKFLSADPVAVRPIGDNFNRYWYANNNPYKFTDPDGRESGAGHATGIYSPAPTPNPQAISDFADAIDQFDHWVLTPLSDGISHFAVAPIVVGIKGAATELKAAQLAKNVVQGAKAEKAVAQELGEAVAGQRVTLEASTGERSVADIVTTDKGVVEVKSGGARLSPGQKAVKADIEAGRAVTPRGQNAAKAGLEPGKPTQMKCYDVKKC